MVAPRAITERAPRLAYGERWIDDVLPARVLAEGRLLPLRMPEALPELPDVDRALGTALETSSTPDLVPSLKTWLATRYRGGDVAILVDDYTRPCAHQRRLLPGLLDWLLAHGVRRERIAIVIAGATHRDPRPAEYPFVLGDRVWPAWRDRVFMHHDYEDLERLGTMPDGTSVELNGRVARSEVVVGLSDLDYHYFAGVSGGPKQIVPGVAGRALTTADHLKMFGDLGFAPNCDMGILDGNPVYEYKRAAVRIVLDALRERGAFVYAVISVLNPRHEIVALEGGEVLTLHRKLRSVLDRVYVAEIPRLADVAIVSALHLGINVYQAGKAINTAARAVRPGGAVLCLAPCPDGFGNEEFRNLMKLAAPILDEGPRAIALGADPGTAGAAAIDRALRAVQDAVMKDFKIGKQKPVDLLVQYRRTGWGNLWLLCDGLTEDERTLLPFRYVGESKDPGARLRAWIEDRERTGKPSYVVIDDPTYWIRPKGG
ncbi:MAG: DUF2088 domain-containing protein [Euryarchaeota archaeon]|nr:DUF2088 domain-containing protein [Euryarchaeota archaeon]